MKHLLTLILLAFLPSLSQASHPFHIYAPSRASNQLLIIEATPTATGLTLAPAEQIDLGFPPTTIVAHPGKPLLYVATNNTNTENGPTPGALITLDPAGAYQSHDDISFYHGYAYLSLDRNHRFLLGANYKDGQVDVYALKDNGAPGPRVAALDEDRTNAHCVLPSPDNKFVYIPYVKDTNALYQYAFDSGTGALTPLDPKNAHPPEGTGPRHMAYHPTLPFVYFSNEQALGVSVYERNLTNGQLTLHQVCDIIPAAERPPSGVSASDIAITPDGKFLFTGLRGSPELPDAIARYRILNDLQSSGPRTAGQVEFLGLTPADAIPWGLALSPDAQYLLVTAFKGATLTAYRITESGDLEKAASLPIDPQISDLVTR